ncbi:transcriptional regulatory protein [Streptomyces albospinus]|uniref:Transcriptional regulatory protein n=1 Tax=Streptomyces albospinus TaxID=285515 RepID=A0ABQ2UQ59_9ACTN|nr:response regulator [Streptomyces albospinus]GGU47746.1 transcriptional regulatory protein [Streptomyces albospinus]
MIDVLVVDDDFYVAEVNSRYVSRVPGFRVMGRAHTAAEALMAVERGSVDLMLLDHYLPGEDGLQLVRRLRRLGHETDIIMVSAAHGAEQVSSALRNGVLQYLVKPFSFAALRAKLTSYAQMRERLDRSDSLGQGEVDEIFGTLHAPVQVEVPPKGYSAATTEHIRDVLLRAGKALSAQEVADLTGVSRSTAQRYLKHLQERGSVQLALKYGGAGRPEHHYESAHGASRTRPR